jgi:hypothetical protein
VRRDNNPCCQVTRYGVGPGLSRKSGGENKHFANCMFYEPFFGNKTACPSFTDPSTARDIDASAKNRALLPSGGHHVSLIRGVTIRRVFTVRFIGTEGRGSRPHSSGYPIAYSAAPHGGMDDHLTITFRSRPSTKLLTKF